MVNDWKRQLNGKVALVTGAGSGIGRESATLFSWEGARIVVCDIDEETGIETVNLITAKGGEALFVKADVSNATEVKKLIQSCVNHFGTLDILYNCAGVFFIGKDGPVTDVDEEVWNSTIAINLTGTFLCCKYAIPVMIENKAGSIINMSSISALVGDAPIAYSASKGGILSLTGRIAVSYASHNIRANTICPGLIRTPMTKARFENPEWLESYKKRIPLQRAGQPFDVARLALYLASDDSSYVTGAAFTVDGGLMAL
jgi:NAD(P)-dependent dehydrogenase (short-subunit alcohol dehydrogenase family)